MLRFMVVVARPGRGPVPQALLEAMDDPTPQLASGPVDHLRWASPEGSLQFGGWSEGRTPVPWLATSTGLAVHAGEALHTDPVLADSEALLRAVLDIGPVAMLDALDGLYALARLGSDGSADIITDAAGLHAMYLGETRTAHIVANDPNLVAAALAAASGTAVEPDVTAMAMVATLGHLVGDRTAYSGVSTLPFGGGVRVLPGRGLEITKPRPDPWAVERCHGLSETMIDELADRMTDLMRATLARHPDGALSELTAGRDSRLVLAIARLAGVVDQITFFTRGSEETVDFVGARVVAERLGLRFQRARWMVPADGWVDRYQDHTARVAGQLAAWDSSEPRGHLGATFSGLFGEMLRTGSPRLTGVDRTTTLIKRFEGLLRHRAGPVRRHVLDDTVKLVVEMFLEPLDEGCDPGELADVYFLEHQQRRLFGAQRDRHTGYFYPLYASGGPRLAFALGPQARLDDVIRVALMDRADLDLDDLEFKKSNRNRRPSVTTASTAPRTPRERPRYRPVDLTRGKAPTPFGAQGGSTRIEAVRQIVAEQRDSAAFEVVDRRQLTQMLDGYESLSKNDRVRVHKAVTPILWMARSSGS